MTVKSCEKLEKSRVALTIETSAEEFEAAVNKAYLKMRGKINVPGLPCGQSPPQDHREDVRRGGVLRGSCQYYPARCLRGRCEGAGAGRGGLSRGGAGVLHQGRRGVQVYRGRVPRGEAGPV